VKTQLKQEEIFIQNMKDNLRKYLLSAGYVLRQTKNFMEPSFLFNMLTRQKKKPLILI
jgi:mannitol/fructose-specific phosphotransferase system IIA component